jgi:hypothetical protein
MDKVSVELAMRYFKTKVYLTFAAMQAELPMDHPNTVESNALCEECDLVATVIDQDGHTYCSKHVRAAVGEIRELHPERRETPQQAEQRVLREALAGSTPLGADEPGAPIGEPGGPPAVEEADLGDAAYINEKASKVKKRQRQAVN